MHTSSRIVTSLLCCAAVNIASAAEVLYATGDAYAVGKQTLLYTESHVIDMQNHTQRTDYMDAHGVTIVRKMDEYHGPATLPSFRQDDLRNGSSFGSYVQDGTLAMFRDDGHGKLKEEKLSVTDHLVIDVGLDHFIRAHWDDLLAHRKITLQFAHPYYLDVFALAASEEEPGDSPLPSKDSKWVYFQLQPTAFFVRMFGSDIHLAYNRDDRRLMMFQGQSNIPDTKGEPQQVTITYRYHETAPAPAAATTQDSLSPEEKETLRKIHRNKQAAPDRSTNPW